MLNVIILSVAVFIVILSVIMLRVVMLNAVEPQPGSAITNRREPSSCLVLVFNSKLGHSATLESKCMVGMQPLVKLKTWPKARPVS